VTKFHRRPAESRFGGNAPSLRMCLLGEMARPAESSFGAGLRGASEGLRGASEGLHGASEGLRGASEGLRGLTPCLFSNITDNPPMVVLSVQTDEINALPAIAAVYRLNPRTFPDDDWRLRQEAMTVTSRVCCWHIAMNLLGLHTPHEPPCSAVSEVESSEAIDQWLL